MEFTHLSHTRPTPYPDLIFYTELVRILELLSQI